MKRMAPVIFLPLALVTACSSGDPSATPATTVTVTETVTATPSSSPTSTSLAPPTSEPLPLGTTVPIGQEGTVTVHGYSADIATDPPEPDAGERWDAADVEVCISVSGLTVSNYPWGLGDTANGTHAASNITYNGFPSPEYPFSDEPVAQGECVRGWIVFDVTETAQISTVRYSGGTAPVRWSAA